MLAEGIDGSALRLGEYLTEWVGHVNGRLRPTTYEGYEVVVRLHVVPLIGELQLRQLKPLDLQRVASNPYVRLERLHVRWTCHCGCVVEEGGVPSFNRDIKNFMLVGLGLPELGCWEVTASCEGAELTCVLRVEE